MATECVARSGDIAARAEIIVATAAKTDRVPTERIETRYLFQEAGMAEVKIQCDNYLL